MDRHEAFHNAIEYVPREPWQSWPYVITIFAQALVAWLVRLPIVCFLLTVVDWLVPVDLHPPMLAFIVVFGPIAWSLAAFAFPGGGWVWHRYIGAREPSKREEKLILESFEEIGERKLAESLIIFVFPHNEYFAFTRGRLVVYSRALVQSDYLTAVTAHEVEHLKSSDAILVQALDRFVLWGDPQPVFEGMNFLTFRNLVLRLLSGRLVLQALKPLWAEYFRQRERAADENVVRHGLGDALAECLEQWELPREAPNPRVAFNLREYIPVEHRIDILKPDEYDDELADEPDDGSDGEDDPSDGPKDPSGRSADSESETEDPPEGPEGPVGEPEDLADDEAPDEFDGPLEDADAPGRKWDGLLDEDDPLDESDELPEELDELPDEAEGLEGPPQ